jgi:hypothetical protein
MTRFSRATLQHLAIHLRITDLRKTRRGIVPAADCQWLIDDPIGETDA